MVRKNLIFVYNYMMGSREEGGVRLFSTMSTDKTRDNGFKVKLMKIHPEHKEMLFLL